MKRSSEDNWEEGQLFVFGDDGEVLPYTEAPPEPEPVLAPEPEKAFEARPRPVDAPRSAEAFLAERSERPVRTRRLARRQ